MSINMPSSLITSIDSVIMRTYNPDLKIIDSVIMRTYNPDLKIIDSVIMRTYNPDLKIRLRTLKVFLLLRKSELKVELINLKLSILSRKWDGYGVHPKPSSLMLLFLRIHSLIGSEMLSEAYSLGMEVDLALLNRMSESSLLTVDEVLGVAHVVLDSAVDLLNAPIRTNFRVSMDAFRLHMLMMRNFLHFAVQTGVELVTVLFHIKPIAINAARVFITDMESFCLAVNRMAADPQVYQAYSQALAAASMLLAEAPSQPVDHGVFKNFLASLISLLWDVLRHSHSDSRSEHPLKALYERLRFTRSTLMNSELDDKIMVQIGVLTCDAGVFIYSPYHVDLGRLSDLLQRFDVLQAQVELGTNPSKVNEELAFGSLTNLNISDGDGGKEFNTSSPIWSHRPPLSSITPPAGGFQLDEVNSILDRLTRGSKQLRIVQISGMAGIGKTTFALQLYNHACVVHHFHACAWYAISQVFDKKKVLLQLLNQIHESESYSNMSEEDLADRLRRSLKGKRYLILLDDVWTPEVWNSLEASFPNDSTGSRIILTSRNLKITGRGLLDEKPYLLRLREESECLKILETKLVHKQGWNLDIGTRIAKMCKGLPLTLGIVAGVLATSEQEGWKGILDQFSSGGVSGALELSYEHLPDYLQPCFLYLGAYPEDTDIYVRGLIQLWMAEGFVRENGSRIEDVALGYMEMLIERSLAMVAKTRSIGGVKSCRIHDLVREFCLMKAKKQSLFHLLLQRNDELSGFNEPGNLQRLVIYSDPIHFKESELFCTRAQSILYFPTGPSFWLFDMSFIIQIFQLVKVLNISEMYLENEIPGEIDGLTWLRYLAFSSKVPVIPSSVGNLFYLETIIAMFPSFTRASLPHTLWNLRNLKCLRISDPANRMDCCNLPADDLEKSSSLLELETLRGVVFCCDDGSMEKLLQKVPNIRRLKCTILPSREISYKIVVPEFLSQLESLTIFGTYQLVKCVFGSSSVGLRKLKMVGFELSKEEIAVIGKLPNLEVLKLHNVGFPDSILDMEEEGFPTLRIFELVNHASTLERWTACDDQLPCLVKLVFRFCEMLEEIPSCLGFSPTLEEIHVYRCSSTVESLVRDVKEVQSDYGNLIKVHIISGEPEEWWLEERC